MKESSPFILFFFWQQYENTKTKNKKKRKYIEMIFRIEDYTRRRLVTNEIQTRRRKYMMTKQISWIDVQRN